MVRQEVDMRVSYNRDTEITGVVYNSDGVCIAMTLEGRSVEIELSANEAELLVNKLIYQIANARSIAATA